MTTRNDRVLWWLAALWMILWMMVALVVPMQTAINTHGLDVLLSQTGLWIVGAMFWCFLWVALHRLLRQGRAVSPYLYAAWLAMLLYALLVQWFMPVLWFALAWSGIEGAKWVAQGLLLGVLLRHHLQVLSLDRQIQKVLPVAAAFVFTLALAVWNQHVSAEESHWLPYIPNVQPAVLTWIQGVTTEEAVNALVTDTR